MSDRLRVVVLGSGSAGSGHAVAFRNADAEVVGMASRTESVVREVATRLEIPNWGTDWRAMIDDLHPDIVAVATPGGTHLEMSLAALDAGCHVYCDKPLATTAADARLLYETAVARGVKTAYAEAYRYQPYILWARELVALDTIGPVREVECVTHTNWPATMPLTWMHQLDEGGGRLNAGFPHLLSMVQHVVGGEPVAAVGETRNDLKRAPIGDPVHHFPDSFQRAYTPEEAARLEWRATDADWSYTALVRLGTPGAPWDDTISACFRHSALNKARSSYFAFYGERGTIHIDGHHADGPLLVWTSGDAWTTPPIPEHITATLGRGGRDSERNWNYLARELIADIRGEGYSGYQTFRDGWIYQEVIEAIRAESGWTSFDFSSTP